MNYTNVEYILQGEGDKLEEYDRMLIKSSVKEQLECPLCNAMMVKPSLEDIERTPIIECANPNCKEDLCAKCGVLWHTEVTCDEYQLERKEKTR